MIEFLREFWNMPFTFGTAILCTIGWISVDFYRLWRDHGKTVTIIITPSQQIEPQCNHAPAPSSCPKHGKHISDDEPIEGHGPWITPSHTEESASTHTGS
jgi:hypothetical protein